MNPVVLLAFSFFGGALLGLFYFNNLWNTTRKAVDEGRQGVFLLTSYFIRTAVVLAGFFIIMSGSWERVVAALAGFILMREIVKRIISKEKAAS